MLAFVEFIVIIVIAIHVSHVNPVPSGSTSPLWRGTYTQSSYWYSDYAVPKPPQKKEYLPSPQFCPETGRTVCSDVKPSYPTDDVFEVIRLAKAKRFNISSEFVDESQNDEEPKFYEDPVPQYEPPPKHEGYVVYQTALHFDAYGHNQKIPYNSHNPNYQPIPYPTQDYGYNNNGGHQSANVPNPGQQMSYPYGSQYAPHVDYPKENSGNYYGPQQAQQPHQGFQIITQTRTRYKRQTGEMIDPVCASRMILVEPKAGLNDRSQWKYVINLADRDPRLKQAIKVEVCQTPGQPCSNQVSLPFGFVSRCKQKYIKKKLLSLDSSGQSISSENFFAPSCCVCEIVRNNARK